MATETLEKNKRLVKDAWEVLLTGNIDGFLSYLDDDVTWKVWGTHVCAGSFHGPQEFRTGYLEPAFAGLDASSGPENYKLRRMTAEDDRVALEATFDTTNKTGDKEYHQSYCFVITIANEKFKEVREYLDTEMVKNVLG